MFIIEVTAVVPTLYIAIRNVANKQATQAFFFSLKKLKFHYVC